MPTYQPTVEEVLLALAAIERTIPGIKKAYDQAPRTLSAAQMPCFVNLPGPVIPDWSNEDSDEAGTELLLTRTYYAVLFVAPNNAGADGEYYAECVRHIDRVWEALLSHPNLGTIGTVGVVITGDTGVRPDLDYAGQKAFGLRFELAVTSRKRAAWADHE